MSQQNIEKEIPTPIFVFWDTSVNLQQQELIKDALYDLLHFVVLRNAKIFFLGDFQFEIPNKYYPSIKIFDDVIAWAWNSERNRLCWEKFYVCLNDNFPENKRKIWKIGFSNKEIYSSENDYLIGGADGRTTLISLNWLPNIGVETIEEMTLRKEALRTEIFHEVGHILGLPTTRRGQNKLENLIGLHCMNPGCSMKQGMSVPDDWIENTKIRLTNGGDPYCQDCIKDLSQSIQLGLEMI